MNDEENDAPLSRMKRVIPLQGVVCAFFVLSFTASRSAIVQDLIIKQSRLARHVVWYREIYTYSHHHACMHMSSHPEQSLKHSFHGSTTLRKHLFKSLANPISNLFSPRRPTQILGPHTIIQHLFNRLFNQRGLFSSSERVAQHHRCRENGTDGVGDALAGNVGSGAWVVSMRGTSRWCSEQLVQDLVSSLAREK